MKDSIALQGRDQLVFTAAEQEKLTRKMDKKLTGSGEVGKPSPSTERTKDILRTSSLGSLKISLVLFLLGVWVVFTPSAAAQQQTLTGWFSMTIADYPSESGLVSEITYVLTEDSGERHELLLDDSRTHEAARWPGGVESQAGDGGGPVCRNVI